MIETCFYDVCKSHIDTFTPVWITFAKKYSAYFSCAQEIIQHFFFKNNETVCFRPVFKDLCFLVETNVFRLSVGWLDDFVLFIGLSNNKNDIEITKWSCHVLETTVKCIFLFKPVWAIKLGA